MICTELKKQIMASQGQEVDERFKNRSKRQCSPILFS